MIFPSSIPATADEIRWALAHQHDGPDGFLPERPAPDTIWFYTPHFPVALINGSGSGSGNDPTTWAAWLDKEILTAEEHRADYYRRMVNWIKDDPEPEPLITYRESSGRWALWDGAHRIASCHTVHRPTIPSLYGLGPMNFSDT